MAGMSSPSVIPDHGNKSAHQSGMGTAFLGRIPPHSNEAELSVLGGILLQNSALDVVAEILRPTDFYSEAHEIVYEAILQLRESSRPVDLIHLAETLKDRGQLDQVGGVSYLSGLLDHVPTAANIESHARLVSEKAAVRSCISAAIGILERGYSDYGEAETYLDQAEQSVFEATRKRSQSRLVHILPALKATFDEINRLAQAKTDITGLPTGFPELDRLTTGLQPSDLVVVAGRPSMGKTAFAMNIATNAVRISGKGVLIFSLEMSIDQLMRRILSSEAGVPASRMRVPRLLTDKDLFDLIEAADHFHKAPVYLDDSAELNVLEIRSRSRRLRAQLQKDRKDLGLVIIDYLQIMRAVRSMRPGRGDTTREREIAEITRSLKALAKELGVPVMCLSQLNRGPEARQDKRPVLADLRESGAIEQDADVIMFLYRESAYTHQADDSTAEVIVGKNRNGPVGTVPLHFHKEFTRFDPMDQGGGSYDYGQSEGTRIDAPRASAPATQPSRPQPPPEDDDPGAPDDDDLF